MFGLPARRWFYNNSAKKERRDWHRWFGDILSNQREKIVEELDVQKVLSPLVCKEVFSWEEYQEVVSCQEQAASLLEKLSCKGPGAVVEFCSVLEEVCPRWLVSVLLDAQGGLSQTSLEDTPENPKMRRASEMDNHDPSEINDVEGKSSLEDPLNHPFNRHREALRKPSAVSHTPSPKYPNPGTASEDNCFQDSPNVYLRPIDSLRNQSSWLDGSPAVKDIFFHGNDAPKLLGSFKVSLKTTSAVSPRLRSEEGNISPKIETQKINAEGCGCCCFHTPAPEVAILIPRIKFANEIEKESAPRPCVLEIVA